MSNSEHEVVEERTEKVDGSHITTEALKFQAKEFALHLVGHREPPQMTGLEVCFRRKTPAAVHGIHWRSHYKYYRIMQAFTGMLSWELLGRKIFKTSMCWSPLYSEERYKDGREL